MDSPNSPVKRVPDGMTFHLVAQSPLIIRGSELLGELTRKPAYSEEPTLLWWFDIDRYFDGNVVGINASAGLAILTTDSMIRAFDLVSGQLRWSLHSSEGTYSAPELAQDEKTLIVQRGSRSIELVDVRSGAIFWSHTGGEIEHLILGRPVIVRSTDGVSGLDEETGRFLWSDSSIVPIQNDSSNVGILASDEVAFIFVNTDSDSPDVDSKVAPNTTTMAVQRSTGRVIWHSSVSEFAPYSAIAVSDALLVNTSERRVSCFEAISGAERWRFEGECPARPFARIRDLLVLRDYQDFLRALRLSDGEELWKHPLSARRYASPENDAGDLFLVWEHDSHWHLADRLLAIDPNSGDARWSYEDTFWSIEGISLSGDSVEFIAEHFYVTEDLAEYQSSSALLVFCLASGELKHSVEIPGEGWVGRCHDRTWLLTDGERLYAMSVGELGRPDLASSGTERWKLLDRSIGDSQQALPLIIRLPTE